MHLGIVAKYPWIFVQFGLRIIQYALLRNLTRRKRKLEIRVGYGQKFKVNNRTIIKWLNNNIGFTLREKEKNQIYTIADLALTGIQRL